MSKAYFADPCDPQTFERSKLDWSQREQNAEALAMHRDLLRLRRDDPVFAAQRADRLFGAVLGPEAFVLRFFGEAGDDRLLVVNLGRDLDYTPAAEPLIVPSADRTWRIAWSSEDPRYGGSGTGIFDPQHWYLPGHAALVLALKSANAIVSRFACEPVSAARIARPPVRKRTG